MSQITGKAKKYDGTAIDYVLLFDWFTGECLGKSVPDAAGNWQYEHFTNLNCGITYVADGCEPITHGAYQFTAEDLTAFNNIGVQGTKGFGAGVASVLPSGFAEMEGTRIVGHADYGNYQYADGSIMVFIPIFYYRWANTSSSRYANYGANSLDVKSKYDFADLAAANAAGYTVHRAFYDNGQIKDGFFIDKYLCSNNAGTASSIKGGTPLSASTINNPISALDGSPTNSDEGAIVAAKTRGASFFVTTIFVQRALSLLSMAHGQAALSVDDCAWYDAANITNFPKGCNNNNFGDVNDAAIAYTPTGYPKAVKTGSANQFAKTTHNGQLNGVADINGVMSEFCIGIACKSGVLHALKTTVKASSLTGGLSTTTDAWSSQGIDTNYEILGANIGALIGQTAFIFIGNATNQVFSSALSGAEWQASCAGIPMSGGTSGSGTSTFGNDAIYYNKSDSLRLIAGGDWSGGGVSGVWSGSITAASDNSPQLKGFRSALYS